MEDDDRTRRIADARRKLRDRFLARMEASPAPGDPRPWGAGPWGAGPWGAGPWGAGPPNRHGMPRLPIGQHEVEKWPVLDLGIVPRPDLEAWRLAVDGAVES